MNSCMLRALYNAIFPFDYCQIAFFSSSCSHESQLVALKHILAETKTAQRAVGASYA